eukprot:gene1670-2013_t
MLPLLGAVIADSFLGRFWTIFHLNIVYMIGLVVLTLSAGLPALQPSPGQDPTSLQMGIFWLALYLIALGTGGIKPNVCSFGADQFNEDCPAELAARSRFYNYFYFFVNVGALIAALVLVPIQENISWTVGFAVPAGAFAIALILFAAGYKQYTRKPPSGSSLGRVFTTGYAAFCKRKHPLPADPEELYEVPGPMSAITGSRKIAHSNKMRFLDHAAVVTSPLLPATHEATFGAVDVKADQQQLKPAAPAAATLSDLVDTSDKQLVAVEPAKDAEAPKAVAYVVSDKWLKTVTHCEEAKLVVLLLPLLLPNLVFQVIYNQMFTLFVLQGDTMDRTTFGKFQVPSASVSFIDTVSVMVMVVIYDSLIAPWWAKRGKPLCLLRRVGWGYVFSALAMVVAAVVEMIRLKVVNRLGLQNADYLNGEVYSNIGLMDLYYTISPDSSKSYAQALTLLTSGISGYISSAMIAGVQAGTSRNGEPGWIADNLNVAHLDYFYWMLAAIQVVAILLHIPIARCYTNKSPHELHDSVAATSAATAPVAHGVPSEIGLTSSCTRRHAAGDTTL